MPRHPKVNSEKASQHHVPGNQHKQEQRGCAESQPSRIGAQITRLPPLQDRAGKRGDAGKQPCKSSENGDVDNPLQNELGNAEERLDHREAVNFVDVILVEQKLVSGRKRSGELLGALRPLAIEPVGDEPAECLRPKRREC